MAEGSVTKGLFIVFEGGEGSGKSTQAERLQHRLAEARHRAVLVREPGTTTLGLYLREYLKSKRPLIQESELLLFMAARAQLVAEEISPTLNKGITVIADRYAGSTVAYQGFGRGIDRDVIDYLNVYVTSGLAPDVTFLLDADPADGLKRVGSPQLRMALLPEETSDPGREDDAERRRFEDQSMTFHQRVRRGYLELARTTPGWHTLDARLTIEELEEQIWQVVGPLMSGGEPALTPTDSPALFSPQN